MGEERSNRKTYVRIYTLFNSRLRAKVIPTRIPITACYADKIRLNPSIQFVHFTNPIYRYSTFFLFLLPPPLQYYTNILRLQFSSIQIREKTFELEETRYVTTHQSWKHARNATTHGPFYEDARTTTRRRSGGLNIDRPTVSLPVSDTETGRPRFQLSSLIFHAFTARGREERRRGGRRKRKRVPCCSPSVRWSGLFPSFVLGPHKFSCRGPRGNKRQITKTAIMWPFPPDSVYIYTHIYTESCTDYGRKFLAGPSPQQASLFSSIYKTFLSSISIFSTKLLYYQLFLPSYLSRERNRKSWKPVWLPSKKIVCPSFRNIEIAVKRRPTARWTTNSLRARKLLCYFNPFLNFFASRTTIQLYIYIFLLVLSLLNLFSLFLFLNSNGKYGREEIFPSLSFVPAIGDKLYSQKYNFLFRLRVLADSSLVARHFRERRIRRFSCSLRGQQLPPLFHATFRCYRYFNVRRQSKYPRLFPPRVIINT